MGNLLALPESNATKVNREYQKRVNTHLVEKLRIAESTKDQMETKLARYSKKRPSVVPQTPSHIKDELWLGNMYDALDSKSTYNFKNMVNCTTLDYGNLNSSTLVISSMRIEDDESEDIFQHLPRMTKFIDDASGPVLVHCEHGISRSATIVIAYLMKYCDMSSLEALIYVRKRRSVICPNEAFLRALVEWEDDIFDKGKGGTKLDDLKKVFSQGIGR